jgi:hypothetical protein
MKRLAGLAIVLALTASPGTTRATGVVPYGPVCKGDGPTWMKCLMTKDPRTDPTDWTVRVVYAGGAVQNCDFVVGETWNLPEFHLPLVGTQTQSNCEDRVAKDKKTSLLALYVLNGGERSLSCSGNAFPPGFDINLRQDQGDCKP